MIPKTDRLPRSCGVCTATRLGNYRNVKCGAPDIFRDSVQRKNTIPIGIASGFICISNAYATTFSPRPRTVMNLFQTVNSFRRRTEKCRQIRPASCRSIWRNDEDETDEKGSEGELQRERERKRKCWRQKNAIFKSSRSLRECHYPNKRSFDTRKSTGICNLPARYIRRIRFLLRFARFYDFPPVIFPSEQNGIREGARLKYLR